MAKKNNNDNKKSSPEEVRLAALLRSRERTEPLVPILRKLTELEIEDNKRFYLRAAAEKYRYMRRGAEDRGEFRRIITPIYLFKRLKELEDLSLGIGLPTTLNGASCIYTATDNYGDKCRVSGNLTFYDNPNKYGFKEISSDEMLPGDLVQSFYNGIPVHSLIFDSYDDSGVPLYNYSKGGEGKDLYVVKGKFPMKQSKVYRYVGFDNEKANGGIINRFNLGGPVGGIVPKGYGQHNFNLTSKINPSKVGIPSGGSGAGSGFLSNLGSNITSFLGSSLGINMLSNAAFGLLNPNGNSTKFGNTLLNIGGLASNIPGGDILSNSLNIVGGAFNTLFGSNINKENVALFRNLNKQLANYTSNASTNEELLADFAGISHLANVKRSDVGSDGWFSDEAKNLTKDINAERLRANLAAIVSANNTAQTIDTTNDLLKGYKLAAYGGPLNMRYTGIMSPFGNLFKDGGIYIKPSKRGTFTAAAKKHGKSVLAFASQVLTNKENYSPAMKKKALFAKNSASWRHDEGGPIKDGDNKELKSFWDKVDGYVNDVEGALALTDAGLLAATAIAPNPATPIIGYGTSVLGGLADIYQGIRSGLKGDYANMVKNAGELGLSLLGAKAFKAAEASKDLYKSSKASKSLTPVVKRTRNPRYHGRIGLPKYFKHVTSLESIDTWNNYLKSAGIIGANTISNFIDFSDSKLENIKAFGGELTHGGIFSNGILEINTGGTHELNPYQGIQVGVDEQGIPNLVEEGELIWNDYVFSNRLKVPKSVREELKLGSKEITFAEAARKLLKESEERPNDPISLNGLNAALSRLAMEQELIRMKKELRLNKYAEGGELGNLYKGTGSKSNFLLFKKKSYPNLFTTPNFSLYAIKDPFKIPLPRYTIPDFSVSLLKPNANSLKGYMSDMFEPINFVTDTNIGTGKDAELNLIDKFSESPLRYAPILGHAAGVFSDLFSKPDYLAAGEVRGIELNPSLVGLTPIANKLRYKPLDTLRLLNPLNALASALRRNVMNISGGNRAIAMAGLLNVDQNLGNQVGLALISADEYNLASEERREAFNRATAQYNAEMGLKAAMANAESRNAMSRARYERDKIAALLSQLARDAYNTRRSNNLNILLEDLGNLGRERNNRNWLDILADKGVIKMNTKGEHVSSNTGKNGGKLNRKKKGGFTYA